jgi:hypothetical protein
MIDLNDSGMRVDGAEYDPLAERDAAFAAMIAKVLLRPCGPTKGTGTTAGPLSRTSQ